MVNLISILSVAGIMWLVAMVFKGHEAKVEEDIGENVIGIYRPTQSDKGLLWSGNVLKADVVGMTTETKI